MNRSTRIFIPTLIVGNASMLYMVFSGTLSELIQNNTIHSLLFWQSIIGIFITVVFNIFGGGLLNRKFVKYYIQEHQQDKRAKQPWE